VRVVLVHDRRSGEPPLPVDLSPDNRIDVVEAREPGPAGARNAGMESADGRFVALLDDDDLWLREHLPRAGALLDSHADATLVATNAYLFYDDSAEGRAAFPESPSGLPRFNADHGAGDIVVGELLAANRILTPTVVMARHRLSSDDRFDTGLRVMEDYDLWLRMAARHRLVYDPEPTVIVRRRPASASTDLRAMAEDAIRVLESARERGLPADPALEALLRQRLGNLWHDLAYACLVEDDVGAARAALRESRARLPRNLKNYIYLLAGSLPAAVRRRIFARGRRVDRPGAEMSSP
jgi:glycosyltransferase involved in cell wall biosynthesis